MPVITGSGEIQRPADVFAYASGPSRFAERRRAVQPDRR
jgi:hypothetical protein